MILPIFAWDNPWCVCPSDILIDIEIKAFKNKVDDYLSAGYIRQEEASAMRSRASLCPPLTYTQTYRNQYDKFVTIQPCTG